jgi:hypothetical protein
MAVYAWSDNKGCELATVCLPWQHWTKALNFYYKFVPAGRTVNKVYYLEVLERLRKKGRRE